MNHNKSFHAHSAQLFNASLLYHRHGFTIVELLVVIVVIAILAAVTIVAFNGVQERARAASVASALNQAAHKMELYSVDNGIYPTALTDIGLADGLVSYQYSTAASPVASYCLTATQGSTSYWVSSSSTTPAKGGCPGHGQSGIAAITNLATNPSFEASLAGVSGYFSSPLVRDTSSAAYGSSSVKTTTNSTTLAQGIIITGANPALPGKQYTCSMSYSGTSGTNVQISGRASTSGGAYIGEGYGNKTVTLGASWQRTSVTFTTPANTGIMMLQIKLASAASGIVIAADGLMCTEGSASYSYADGGSTSWVWNGTPHLSTSTGPAL